MSAAGKNFELAKSDGHVRIAQHCLTPTTASTRNEVAGAGGFEPPNTGSKVPRLTAWPRPRNIRETPREPLRANYKRLSVADLMVTGNPWTGSARSRGNRPGCPLMRGAAERARDQGPRTVTRQRFNGT